MLRAHRAGSTFWRPHLAVERWERNRDPRGVERSDPGVHRVTSQKNPEEARPWSCPHRGSSLKCVSTPVPVHVGFPTPPGRPWNRGPRGWNMSHDNAPLASQRLGSSVGPVVGRQSRTNTGKCTHPGRPPQAGDPSGFRDLRHHFARTEEDARYQIPAKHPGLGARR